MKRMLTATAALLSLSGAGCVAGPGGANNAANRTIAGVAIGTLLGGVVGQATGNAASGLVLGAIAGGAAGAAINPEVFGRDTRGYCYTVDAQGQPITILADEMECKVANGRMVDVTGQP